MISRASSPPPIPSPTIAMDQSSGEGEGARHRFISPHKGLV